MKFVLLAVFLAMTAASSRAAQEVPPLARLAGLRVGLDTVQKAERRFGRGTVTIGGHARGGRLWRLGRLGGSLWMDGFYYNSHGDRIIDSLSIQEFTNRTFPRLHLPRKQTLFLGIVTLGMSRAEALRAVADKLPTPQEAADRLIWEVSGTLASDATNHYKVKGWKAELRFQQDRLHEIFVEAEFE